MKNRLPFGIALLCIAALAGCKKAFTDSKMYKMSATVNGTTMKFDNCYGNIAVAGLGGSVWELSGFNGATHTGPPEIGLYITNYNHDTGTFDFDTTMYANYAMYITAGGDIKLAKSGSMTITSVSPSFIGFFSLKCTDGTLISGGTFTGRLK